MTTTPNKSHQRDSTRQPRHVLGGLRARLLGVTLAVLAAATVPLLSTTADAHATLVIGTLSFEPDPPIEGGGLTATIRLEDPGLVEVEDAVVFLEFRALEDAADAPSVNAQPDSEALFITDRLPEPEAGLYRIDIPPLTTGTYLVSVRDRTYRQEEAVANLVLTFSNEPLGELPFVLPPTATGPASLGTWLVWLIGVPLAAGVLVTVLVLRGGRDEDDDEATDDGDTDVTDSTHGDGAGEES